MMSAKYFIASIILLGSCTCDLSDYPRKKSIENDTVILHETDIRVSDQSYVYEVTNKKSGEVIILSQEEYLKSGYGDNPSYSVREKMSLQQDK